MNTIRYNNFNTDHLPCTHKDNKYNSQPFHIEFAGVKPRLCKLNFGGFMDLYFIDIDIIDDSELKKFLIGMREFVVGEAAKNEIGWFNQSQYKTTHENLTEDDLQSRYMNKLQTLRMRILTHKEKTSTEITTQKSFWGFSSTVVKDIYIEKVVPTIIDKDGKNMTLCADAMHNIFKRNVEATIIAKVYVRICDEQIGTGWVVESVQLH